MKRVPVLGLRIFIVLFLSIIVHRPTLQAQESLCALESILNSYQAAALSEEVEAWSQSYATSECSVTTKRGVSVLVQAFGLLASDARETGNAPIAPSTFDADDEGWTFSGDATPIEWNSDGGNPGGTICATDRGENVWWYYEASPSFMDSISSAYGLTLRFDLKQEQTDQQGNLVDQLEDLFLTGVGQTLVYNTNYNPGSNWTSYSVMLTESSSWLTSIGTPPTRQQFENVLANATNLSIRGEYREGEDSSCLDNVELSAG